jgi:ABC-2 type transport system permease protein
LRDNRAGIFGCGGGLAALMFIGASQYPQFITGTGAAREQALAEMTKALRAFSFMTGEVTSIDTIGGFLSARMVGPISVVVSIWVLVVGVGLIRGEEQQGALDMLLSTPKSRHTAFAQKAVALVTALAGAVLLAALGLALGILLSGHSVAVDDFLQAMLNVFAIGLLWGSVGLLAGQVIGTRRKASGTVGALVMGTYLLNNIFESSASLETLSRLMPFHYYSVSKPLAPERVFDVGAWLLLIGFSAIALVLAALFFVRRDIGSIYELLHLRPSGRRAHGPLTLALLDSVLSRSLREILVPSLLWGLGLGLFGAVLLSTAEQALQPLRELARNTPILAAFMGDLTTNEAYLAIGLFTYLPLLLAVFSILQVEGWASDEEEGRLEVLLSTPVARPRVLVARLVSTAVGLALILTFAGLVVLISSAAFNVPLDASKVTLALAAALPVSFLVAAFGLFLATWLKRPGPAVAVTSATVAAMFFLETLGRLFNLSEAVLNLSIFHLYGRPLIEGVAWGTLLAVAAVSLAFCAGALAGLARRDITK